MTGTSDEIIARLRLAAESGSRIERLLFHGTCEAVEGSLRPGGDGLLWTSDSPVIAQQYIPAAGLEIMCSQPMAYEMNSRVRPNLNDAMYRLACEVSGKTVDEVERDAVGNVKSWAVPDGWPRYRDVIEHIEGPLGYSASNGTYWLKARTEDGREQVMPASWSIAGSLYVTLADGLNLKDIRQGEESDLTLYEHNNVEGFAAATREGYDGVIINDFAQTTHYGNFGHRSYGLNERGIGKAGERTWLSLPAVRFDFEKVFPFPEFTPDLRAWLETLDHGSANMASFGA